MPLNSFIKRNLPALLCGGLLLPGARNPRAADPQPYAPSPEAQPADAHLITLDEVITAALENNQDIRIIRYDHGQQDARVEAQRGLFDPAFGLTGTSAQSERLGTPVPNPDINSYSSINWQKTLEASVSQNLPWGGVTSLNYTMQKTHNDPYFGFNFNTGTVNSVALNPAYATSLTLNYTQPLLRGFGTDAGALGLKIARLTRQGTLALDKETLAARLIDVERAYWALLAAQENYRVARQDKELSLQFHDETMARIKAGVLPEIDQVTADAGVADKEEAIITAENNWRNAADTLRRLVSPGAPQQFDGTLTIMPPRELAPPSVRLEDSLAAARSNRPQRDSLKTQLDIAKLNASAARINRRPQLNLVTSYGLAGSAGPGDYRSRFDPDPASPVFNVGSGFGGANSQISHGRLGNYSIGLNFGISLFNRTPRAEYTDARVNALKAEILLESYDSGVELEVRTAARGYESGYKRVLAAQANVRLQEKKAEAEKVRYQNGLSTGYQVLQFQNDLSRARSAEVAAMTDYLLARSVLEKATGNYLEYRKITLTDLAPPEK
jgi:outer membrane protein TolC